MECEKCIKMFFNDDKSDYSDELLRLAYLPATDYNIEFTILDSEVHNAKGVLVKLILQENQLTATSSLDIMVNLFQNRPVTFGQPSFNTLFHHKILYCLQNYWPHQVVLC